MSANWYHLQTCNHWSRVPQFHKNHCPSQVVDTPNLDDIVAADAWGREVFLGLWLTWLMGMDVHKLHKDFPETLQIT